MSAIYKRNTLLPPTFHQHRVASEAPVTPRFAGLPWNLRGALAGHEVTPWVKSAYTVNLGTCFLRVHNPDILPEDRAVGRLGVRGMQGAWD